MSMALGSGFGRLAVAWMEVDENYWLASPLVGAVDGGRFWIRWLFGAVTWMKGDEWI